MTAAGARWQDPGAIVAGIFAQQHTSHQLACELEFSSRERVSCIFPVRISASAFFPSAYGLEVADRSVRIIGGIGEIGGDHVPV